MSEPPIDGLTDQVTELAIRQLLASCRSGGAGTDGLGTDDGDRPGQSTGLDLPPADAGTVARAARRLARNRRVRLVPPLPIAAALWVARALVVDEHPSAAEWDPADREEVVASVALLLQRSGEDGVRMLVDALGGRRPGARSAVGRTNG